MKGSNLLAVGARFLLIATASMLVSGCVSLATPERPAYTGVDQIDSVDSQQLVGIWRVTELNPIPDGVSSVTLIEYKPDGTVSGQIKPNGDDAASSLGALSMNGQWSVDNGMISHSEITMTSESNSQFGGLIADMINRSTHDMGGEANIFEVSSNRIVMVGPDGTAMQYDRR